MDQPRSADNWQARFWTHYRARNAADYTGVPCRDREWCWAHFDWDLVTCPKCLKMKPVLEAEEKTPV